MKLLSYPQEDEQTTQPGCMKHQSVRVSFLKGATHLLKGATHLSHLFVEVDFGSKANRLPLVECFYALQWRHGRRCSAVLARFAVHAAGVA